MKNALDYISNFTLPNGLDIEIDQGWKKLISRQFGGQIGRGFNELIQNLIDSYPLGIPFEKRKGQIITSGKSIAIIDYGEGLDSERINLLLTLGGTDKADNNGKIGQFGIGFYSIFDPRLETKKVEVTTLCEGQVVKINFAVTNPEKRPHISAEVLNTKTDFSTKIEIFFNYSNSVDLCLDNARQYLWYYPCRVKIDNEKLTSIWSTSKKHNDTIFQTEKTHGIIKENSRTYYGNKVDILCKYEYIMSTSFDTFFKGSHNTRNDLIDYRSKGMPYIKDFELVVNNNNLGLTISRDGFYIDSAFTDMVNDVIHVMVEKLIHELSKSHDPQLILANQYIFDYEISDYLLNKSFTDERLLKLTKLLAEAKVYNISGKSGKYSLSEIYHMKSENLPLFYSEKKENLRWLGGEFKHDFIVLPEECLEHNNFDEFYKRIFKNAFDDVVNLDTIANNHSKIAELVERDIIEQSALTPKFQIIEYLRLSDKQKIFAREIEELVSEEAIRYIFSDTIRMPIDNIKTAFFAMDDEKCHVPTGLFTNNGMPIDHKIISNYFEFKKPVNVTNEHKPKHFNKNKTEIMLGISIENPLIQLLINSIDKNRMYYALTYITNELAICQKKLVPNSDFSSWEKKILSSKMRKVFIEDILRKNAREERS